MKVNWKNSQIIFAAVLAAAGVYLLLDAFLQQAHVPDAYDRDPEYNKQVAKVITPQPRAQSTHVAPDEPWSCASGSIVPWRNEIVAELELVPETYPKGTSEKNLVEALKKYGYTCAATGNNAPCPRVFSYWKRTGHCSVEERTIRWYSDANGKITEVVLGSSSLVIATPIVPAENQTLALPNTPPAPNGDPFAELRAKVEAKRRRIESQ